MSKRIIHYGRSLKSESLYKTLRSKTLLKSYYFRVPCKIINLDKEIRNNSTSKERDIHKFTSKLLGDTQNKNLSHFEKVY